MTGIAALGSERRVARPPEPLAPFVDTGILAAADVHVATTLARVLDDTRPEVLLGAALAVRAPRRTHVCADLAHAHLTVGEDEPGTVTTDPGSLPWPPLDRWRDTLASSPLVAVRSPAELDPPDDPGRSCPPLTLAGDRLYLDRLWRYERIVAGQLTARAVRPVAEVDTDVLAAGLGAAFHAAAPDRQRIAAATAVGRHLAVIAGGPGTGKTTTVAQVLVLLDDQARARGLPPPSVALAAPTGKAAGRLTESLREAVGRLGRSDDDPALQRLRQADATTIHALLGPRGDSRSRFRHDRGNPLPHDVVVIDETSMVSLALVAKLLAALRNDTRLVLLGDPEQLASVDAGSVLGDVVGDAARRPLLSAAARQRLGGVAGDEHLVGWHEAAATGIDDAIVVLDRVHRFRSDSGIAAVADAVQRGDADTAITALRAADDIDWHVGEAAELDPAPVRRTVVAAGAPVLRSARDGDADAALDACGQLRVLCAHRHGPAGVTDWVERIEGWLAADVADVELRGTWYLGRPVLVTANDRRLRVANGDVGVVVRGPDDVPLVALPEPDGTGHRLLAPSRLPGTETVHAMTVHKSQGSQFDHVVVVLPPVGSPLLTRELLYTALTRGRRRATVLGSEAALRTAIGTRAIRASGLSEALRLPRPGV